MGCTWASMNMNDLHECFMRVLQTHGRIRGNSFIPWQSGGAYLIDVFKWRLTCHLCILFGAIFSSLPGRPRALCWHGTSSGATHPLGYPYLDISSCGSALHEQASNMKRVWRVRHWPSGCWASIHHHDLVRSSYPLHSDVCNAVGACDEVILSMFITRLFGRRASSS